LQSGKRRLSTLGLEEGEGAGDSEGKQSESEKKNKGSLKTSFVKLNKDLSLLQNYCILNYTAFVKITKKYAKQSAASPVGGTGLVAKIVERGRSASTSWDAPPKTTLVKRVNSGVDVENYSFHKAEDLTELIDKLEVLFADSFCSGNRMVAHTTLRIDQRTHFKEFNG
jgi:hypothetical protein